MNIAQPDIKLVLDADGVIREAALGDGVAGEAVDGWLGCAWADTVIDGNDGKIERMLADARRDGVSGFRQVNQRFPSGLELPVEYTTVCLGPGAGMLAVGKSLRAVAELQSRLLEAQQTLERDYWKLRDFETRYRQLFEASNEAVLLLRATSLRIVDANPAALRALGLGAHRGADVAEREMLPELPAEEQTAFQATLQQAREHGKAPGILVHLGPAREPWLLRASLLRTDSGQAFLLQLAAASARPDAAGAARPDPLAALVRQGPDGLLLVDPQGIVKEANDAFLEMVQVGSTLAVVGGPLERWFARGRMEVDLLLATLRRLGRVRLFPAMLRGELGSEAPVEISAVAGAQPDRVLLLVRDVSRRAVAADDTPELGGALEPLTARIGGTPMRTLVRETVAVVEQHFIRRALEATRGNRTAAAELLGLSRQSLYAKLARYALDEEPADDDNP